MTERAQFEIYHWIFVKCNTQASINKYLTCVYESLNPYHLGSYTTIKLICVCH
jgi:hypothetical protein